MAEKEVKLIDVSQLYQCKTCRYHKRCDFITTCDHGEMYSPDMSKLETIDPESIKSNKRTIPLDEVYRVIAGHSDYHGDNILAALTCIAEGRDVKPVKPLDDLRPQWISVEDRLPDANGTYIVWIKGAQIPGRMMWILGDWAIGDDERDLYPITHWMPLPEPPEGE